MYQRDHVRIVPEILRSIAAAGCRSVIGASLVSGIYLD